MILRVVFCAAVALVPLGPLQDWASDLLLRLRAPSEAPTQFILLETAPDSVSENALQLAQKHTSSVFEYNTQQLQSGVVRGADCVVRAFAPGTGEALAHSALLYHRLVGAEGKPTLPQAVLPRWRGPSGSFPALSPDTWATRTTELGDKIVLVADRRDNRSLQTPLGEMSLLEFQANALDSLVTQSGLAAFPLWAKHVLSLATVAASFGILLHLPLTYASGWLVALAFAWVAAAWFALLGGVLLPFLSPVLAIVATHLALLGYKLKRQEAQTWQTQRDAEYTRQLDEFKNNFVSLFSHDLKTPIARIKALVQMGLSHPPGSTQKVHESLRNIDRASDDLSRLISDILKVTKMESMPLEMQRDAVDLNRMVQLATERLKYAAEEKKLQFVLDLEPLFPIEGDPQLIQEIILNLAENAVKYGFPGTQVCIRTNEEPGRVRVTVSDQGPGIPADEIPRVSEKFYRGRLFAKSTSGTGLGLYLAKYFVEMHQGKLEIRSQVDRGTEVSFWLPSPN